MADKQTLYQALIAHQPMTEVERVHQMMAQYVLMETRSPLSRKQFTPGHFTASAWIINPAHTHTLLLKHPQSGRWQMPGGHPDDSSDLFAVALREVGEETGLTASKLYVLEDGKIFDVDGQHVTPNPIKNEPEHLHFDIRYVFKSKSNALPVSPENLELRWVNWKDAEALFPPDGGRYRCVQKLKALRI